MRQLAAPAPATALDRSATRRRVVGFGVTSVQGARAAGRRHGATINDVLLAAATIALGRALRRRGERPGTVKVLVPVNVRGRGEATGMGNRISFVTVSLPVAVTDPLEVLRDVRTQTRARKAGGGAAPLEALSEIAELLPGGARRVVARSAARAASFNAVVSNVPGPPVELDLLGRRVSAIFPAVPFLEATRCRSARSPIAAGCTAASTPTRPWCPTRPRSPATSRQPSMRCASSRAGQTRPGARVPSRAVSAPRSGRPGR